MLTMYHDSMMSDRQRLEELYAGHLFLFSPSPATTALCDHARAMIAEAFEDRDPLHAQEEMDPAAFVSIVAPLKTAFIHHPRSKELIREILAEFKCNANVTYLDVPRLRISTHSGYLTSGVAYAHHPHRDTWYAAPPSQINWWMAIYEYTSESGMAFHPGYWRRPIANSSNRFDYYEWNANGRKNAAEHITSDTRFQPKPEEPLRIEPPLRLVSKVASPTLFSGAHLHSTVHNTSGRTRWSIDFRTVNIDDVIAGRGAPNLDAHPKGTSLRDFMRAADLRRVSEEIALEYDERSSPTNGQLIFTPHCTPTAN